MKTNRENGTRNNKNNSRNNNSSGPNEMHGYMDRGSVSFKSKITEHDGDIMAISTRDVVTAPATTNIIGAVRIMTSKGFRRLPITDAGTGHIVGIVTCLDIVDFLGGGERHKIISEKFAGNINAAVNESVRKIMKKEVIVLDHHASIADALNTMMKEKIGGIPILNSNGEMDAIVSERDFVHLVAGIKTGITINDCMSHDVVTVSPDTTLRAAAKVMIKRGFRRLPIVKNGILLGIVTSFDVMKYLGSGDIFKSLVNGNSGKLSDAFEMPIKHFIKRDVIWAPPHLDVGEAASIMLDKGIGSLPVIDNGKLAGIITERDFLDIFKGA